MHRQNWKCLEMSNFTDIIEIRIKLGTVFLDKWFRINFFSETEKPVSLFGLSHLFLKCLFNLPKNYRHIAHFGNSDTKNVRINKNSCLIIVTKWKRDREVLFKQTDKITQN